MTDSVGEGIGRVHGRCGVAVDLPWRNLSPVGDVDPDGGQLGRFLLNGHAGEQIGDAVVDRGCGHAVGIGHVRLDGAAQT